MTKYSRVDFVDGRKLQNTELNELQEQSILRDRGLLEAIYGVPKGVVKAIGTPRANGMVVEATVFAFGSVYTVNQTVNGIYTTSHTTDTDAVIYAEIRATIVTGDQDTSLRHPTLAINTANRIQHIVTLKSVVGAPGVVPADVTTGGEVYNVPVMAVKGRFNTNPAIQAGVVKVYGSLLKYVDDRIVGLVDSAPGVLDTLNELSKALGDDPNFATTMTNLINKKLDKVEDLATQVEAETGDNNTHYMTPQRTKQAIAKNMEALKPTNVTVASPGGTVASSMKSPVNVKRIDGRTDVNPVPLFASGTWVLGNATVLAPNRLQLSQSAVGQRFVYTAIGRLASGVQHTLNYNGNLSGHVDFYNGETHTLRIPFTKSPFTFNPPSGHTSSAVAFGSDALAIGTYEVSDVRIAEGTQAQPFVANIKGLTNPTIVNEVNGTSLVVPTTLYTGDYVEQNAKGELVKYKKYQEILLDSKFTYAISVGNADNSKAIIVNGLTGYATESSLASLRDHRMVKYNGAIVLHDSVTLGDRFNMVDTFRISIPNADSGWGANYSPTPVEILACMLGWKMFDASGGKDLNTGAPLYNGTGIKSWQRYAEGATKFLGLTASVPTTPNVISSVWQPYRLIYELATPIQVVIEPYGDLLLEKGDNSLKVYAGRIVNEKVSPKYLVDNSSWYIADSASFLAGSKLVYAPEKIRRISRNGQDNTKSWNIYFSQTNMQGLEKANIHNVHFDQTASYAVDYEPLYSWEVTSPVDAVQLAYFETLQSVTNELVQYMESLGATGARSARLLASLVAHTNEVNPHAENANRTIIVGQGTGFPTIQSALDSIKRNLGGRAVQVLVPANYHTEEAVEVSGFNNGLLVVAGDTVTRARVSRITVSDCSATVSIQNFTITGTDVLYSGVLTARCTNVEIIAVYDNVVRDTPGVYVSYSANVFVRNSSFTNKRTAFKMGAGYLTEAYNVYGTVKYVFEVAWGSVAYATTNYVGSATVMDVYAYDGGRVFKQ